MDIKKIKTEEEFNQLVGEGTFLFFKHSLTCPISAQAFQNYQQFVKGNPEVKTAYLAVQEAKPLSNYVAETYGIRHESPQAIVFTDGQPVWNESHSRITKSSLSEAIAQ